MLLSLLSAVAAVAPTPPAPQPIDIGSWFSASDYPAMARRQGAEGVVAYRIDVDPAGRPIGCQVTQSAGPALDQPTCDLLMRRSHFTPAADASGKAVAGRYIGRIRWNLPPQPVAPVFNQKFGAKPALRLPVEQVETAIRTPCR